MLQAEHATLSFLVCSIYNKLYKRLLKVEHSCGDGYYMVDFEYEPITEQMAADIKKELTELLNSPTQITLGRMEREPLVKFFEEHGYSDKLGLLKTWNEDLVPCINCGEFVDYTLEPMSTDKNRLKLFDIHGYENGIILRFPMLLNPEKVLEWSDPHAIFDMFREYREWAKLMEVDNVSKLNSIIYNRKIDDLKWIAEGLHSQKFSKIAKHLIDGFPAKRVVTIAGPSSSNKTTFALRLAIQLRVNGYKSTVVSMDDYYKNTADIPFGEDGLQDFESIDALNVEILGKRVQELLKGEEVPLRHFDFHRGVGFDDEKKTMKLHEKEFLIIEGIHGLNPELISSLGPDNVTPIYVSALTPLNIDFNHRFPTSDLRLIRRIIRDYRYRGYSPRKTIMRWTSVRLGEEKNIFPFQGNAELFFNSSLIYELPVLSVQGKALLAEATVPDESEDPTSPETQEVTKEARRLLGLLNVFYPVSDEIVPHISCIREFIGGSDLKY
jgi:uridine kinase